MPWEKLDGCSPAFLQFLKRLLDKNPDSRPSIDEVLGEAWLKEDEGK